MARIFITTCVELLREALHIRQFPIPVQNLDFRTVFIGFEPIFENEQGAVASPIWLERLDQGANHSL
ncbi:MAG: hypothetical protein EAZ61_07715 [Oscillatoriales cyanobacterium]|nr:MAG: hypothetical protein EAZ61_07715 [Oscillatoriales cyanobacterium]